MTYEAMLVAFAYFVNPELWTELAAQEAESKLPLKPLAFALKVLNADSPPEHKRLQYLVDRLPRCDTLMNSLGRQRVREIIRFYAIAGGYDWDSALLEVCPDPPGQAKWWTEFRLKLECEQADKESLLKRMAAPARYLKPDAKSRGIKKASTTP